MQPAAYVGVPAMIHRVRASGLLAAGKADAARREAALVRAAMPGNADLALILVPEFDRAGLKQDATELFDGTLGAGEADGGLPPLRVRAHNSAAWLAACCRRDLDKGLAHAQKAVGLAPEQAGYHDTLAEVRFQRGDKAAALAAERKAAGLNPKRAYYRKQLKRIEAGDPAGRGRPRTTARTRSEGPGEKFVDRRPTQAPEGAPHGRATGRAGSGRDPLMAGPLFAQLFESAWRGFLSFSDRYANAASVAGLTITLVGFAVTLWGLRRIGQVTRDAEGRIRQATEDARRDVQRTLETARQETREIVGALDSPSWRRKLLPYSGS